MIDKSYYYLSHKIRLFYDFYSKHTTMVTKKLCILRFFWFLCSKTHYYVSQLIIILLKKYNFYRIYAQKLDTMITKKLRFWRFFPDFSSNIHYYGCQKNMILALFSMYLRHSRPILYKGK